MGIDPGDRLEFDTNVYADGLPVVLRSLHKPLSHDFDSWQWYLNQIHHGPVSKVSIDIVANVTGENSITPRPEGKDTAKPHWGIWLLWK
jgi:hypothetical protein